MKSFALVFFGIWTIGFSAGIIASSSATSALDRVVTQRTADYCAAGLEDFCK